MTGAWPLARRARSGLRRSPLARTLQGKLLSGIDGVERALGRRASLEPPRRLRGVGAGDFRAVGAAVLDLLIEHGCLRPDARVLDIGCGSGRVAVPLTDYLRDGCYEGFDVNAEMIDWCRQTIGARHASFGFTVIDVSNTHYNRAGAVTAPAARFPYDDEAFDFALATSLFTHLLPAGFANYARETARVLVPGATFFATFCLINEHSSARIERGEATIDLSRRVRDADAVEYRALDPRSPETAVGLGETFVRSTLEAAGLEVTAVHPGVWSGHPAGVSYQDVVIARKSV